MMGYEKMMIQGIGPDAYPSNQFTSYQIAKLSGEAFNAYALIVVLVGFYNCFPVRWEV